MCAQVVERRGEGGRASAATKLLVNVAGGLAGNTPHMMAATLSALARLMYELRGREEMVATCARLFATVLALLQHKAQEVVRAVIVFSKVTGGGGGR